MSLCALITNCNITKYSKYYQGTRNKKGKKSIKKTKNTLQTNNGSCADTLRGEVTGQLDGISTQNELAIQAKERWRCR